MAFRHIAFLIVSLSILANAGRSSAQNTTQTEPKTQGVEILSDTQSVDFTPYIRDMLKTLRGSWMNIMAQQDTSSFHDKNGYATIRLTINPDGTLSQMRLDDSSHERAIDRSAWQAVTEAKAFSPLPAGFKGPNIELRIRFVVGQDAPQVVK